MTKTCSRCKEVKDTTVFYKLKASEDLLDYLCKLCRDASAKKTWTNNKRKCSTQDCDKPHYARTMCKCCYHKLIRREKKEKK